VRVVEAAFFKVLIVDVSDSSLFLLLASVIQEFIDSIQQVAVLQGLLGLPTDRVHSL
jgi:hypothetical protein